MNELYATNSVLHNHYSRQSHLLHINTGNINVFTKHCINTSARTWNILQCNINVPIPMSNKLYLQDNPLDLKLY